MTANLPARDLDATAAFYAALGFAQVYRDTGWMIMVRGTLTIEFFPHPGLDPYTSWFSACIRCDDLGGLYDAFSAAGISDDPRAIPRLTPPQPRRGPVPAMFALVDPNGSLLRCLQNEWADEQ